MALEMRTICEKCESALTPDGEAYICSHECTFCKSCREKMAGVCPNCSGELIVRPKRLSK